MATHANRSHSDDTWLFRDGTTIHNHPHKFPHRKARSAATGATTGRKTDGEEEERAGARQTDKLRETVE